MLKVTRVLLALVCLVALTALFVDTTGLAATRWGWIARWQVVPALLSVNVVVIAVLAAVTLLMGRVYCSVLCPLGVLQDVVARIRIWLAPRRRRKIGVYHTRRGIDWLRYTVFGLFVLAVCAGLAGILATSLGALIEPYSAYGRLASGLFAPVTDAANNALADYDAAHGGYTFWTVTRHVAPLVTAIGALTFIVVAVCAVVTGRGYCNNFCPVGTLLGFVSRHALIRVTIDTDKCNGCGSCARHCKGGCIDARAHRIDYSRCVTCMDCVGHCSQSALKLRWAPGKPAAYSVSGKAQPAKPAPSDKSVKSEKPTATAPTADKGRRQFMAILGAGAGALAVHAADKVTDGGLTPLKTKTAPARATRIVPPGAISLANLNAKCVGCQLCVQSCPNGIIRTSTELETLMQPVLDYSAGYCTPECTRCSEVCPTGAIVVLDEPAKSSTKIGTATVDLSICLSAQGSNCGSCSRHCPAGAIEMVSPDGAKGRLPIVNAELCIGCGACEYHCPVGTVATIESDHPAIHVEGVEVQRTV